MRNLAAEVGYSATAIYSYFADKDAVLKALMDADCVALRRALDDAAAEPDPVEKRVRKMGRGRRVWLPLPRPLPVPMLTEQPPA